MRRVVRVPHAGFGARGLHALKTLPPRLQRLVVAELDDPESAQEFAKILQRPDAEQRLSRLLSSEIAQAIQDVRYDRGAGLGDLSGFSFKKLVKKVVGVHKKVAKVIGKPLVKAGRSIAKTTKKVWTRYGNIIIGVLGAVLAPFTGGASLAVAALLTTANTMYMKKRQADRMKQVNAREAARLNAEVAAEEAKLKADLDKIYNENTSIFEGAGITRDKWNGLSLEQKLAVIEKINKGEMPASQAAANAAADAADVLPPTQTGDWMTAIQSASIYQQALASAAPMPGAGVPSTGPSGGVAPSGPPALMPPYEGEGGEAPPEAPPKEEAPAGKYELKVEGELVYSSTNPDDMFNKVGSVTKTGDRFEVFLNGKSLGLKIRAAGGVIPVPPDQEARVRSMSHGEVVSMIQRAAEAAKTPEKEGGGFPLWLLAIPAGLFLAKAA